MLNRDSYSAAFWILFGLIVIFLSYKLGLTSELGQKNVFSPGPGLMPFSCGTLIVLLSTCLFFQQLRTTLNKPLQVKRGTFEKFSNIGKIGLVLSVLFGYAAFIEPLGYVATTVLALVALFKCMQTKWLVAVCAAFLTATITYIVFLKLGVHLPEGIIGLGFGV